MSLPFEPQMPMRSAVVLLVITDQLLPLNLRMVPPAPTANTLFDAVPHTSQSVFAVGLVMGSQVVPFHRRITPPMPTAKDRKSTRLNSSHQIISYAVFCLKKK